MERRHIVERPTLPTRAKSYRFDLHHLTGDSDSYWREDACWIFRRQELEDWLLPASRAIYKLLMSYLDQACSDPDLLRQADVPRQWWTVFKHQRLASPDHLLIRLDLAYDGHGLPQLLECEVEAPGSIFETGFFQLQWFEALGQAGGLPPGANQWNRLHDALVERFSDMLCPSAPLHVAAAIEDSEDWLQARYLSACAAQAGHQVLLIDPASIRSGDTDHLIDSDGQQIRQLLMLQRWHHLLCAPVEQAFIPALNAGLRLVAPVWTHLLSSKSCLAALWRLFPDHPLLLPAFVERSPERQPGPGQVKKPLHGHRGEGIVLVSPDGSRVSTSASDSSAKEAWVMQQFAHQCMGQTGQAVASCRALSSWLVAGRPVALGMREGSAAVLTGSNCRFVPHVVLP